MGKDEIGPSLDEGQREMETAAEIWRMAQGGNLREERVQRGFREEKERLTSNPTLHLSYSSSGASLSRMASGSLS